MAIGLKDVAARAGVSIKTVSNVVNGQRVLPDTRAKVEEAIAELGYRPNLSARSLRSGRTGVIALAVPDLTVPYFAELARAVIVAAEERGWTVLVDQTDGSRERELLVLEGIRSPLIDGAIFSPLALGPDDRAARNHAVPLVLIGERIFPGSVDHVAIDNVAAARAAVEHLLERGRRRVALVGDQHVSSADTARLRTAGWREALEAAGLEASPELLVPAARWHRDDGYDAVRSLLASQPRPDALFCCNDLLAVGALRALAEAGLRVPEDVAVVGIDDIEESRFTSPALTTVAPDKDAIARTSVDLLARRIDQGFERRAAGETAPPDDHQDVRAGHRLVVRESS
jgi:DNA-binding LacI/PurR family transcriptional regulator